MRPKHADREIALLGGNMTPVVRVGETVRRAAGPWTPTIHAFMRHLRASGFDRVPEPLGIGERGREIISVVAGAPATYPLPSFAWSDATLTTVARTLRAYHDASVGFTASRDASWQWPSHHPAEVICHNDFAPYNLMFEHGRLAGVIDLDLASPGPRVWDMGYAAYRFVPLTHPANPDAPFSSAHDQARRLTAFCEAYGKANIAPRDVGRAAVAHLRELVAFIERQAAAGDAAQQAVLARGDVLSTSATSRTPGSAGRLDALHQQCARRSACAPPEPSSSREAERRRPVTGNAWSTGCRRRHWAAVWSVLHGH